MRLLGSVTRGSRGRPASHLRAVHTLKLAMDAAASTPLDAGAENQPAPHVDQSPATHAAAESTALHGGTQCGPQKLVLSTATVRPACSCYYTCWKPASGPKRTQAACVQRGATRHIF